MITLNRNLLTGHSLIDEQHCLFLKHLEAINRAIEAGAGRQKIADLITILQKYSLDHFTDEEEYMRAVDCPALEENRNAHRDFARKIEGWLDLLVASGAPVSLLADIQHESTTWMLAHIVQVDCKLRSCRQA